MLRDAAYLTAWLRSWRSGFVSLDQALDAITPFSKGQRQADLIDASEQPWDWVDAAQSISADPNQIRLVAPVPGDMRGLPVESAVRLAAMRAGAAVIAGEVALVPRYQEHQSGSGDEWTSYCWQAWYLSSCPPAIPVSLSEADTALSEATQHALSVLESMPTSDQGNLVPDTEDDALPPGFAPRARRLFARAWTIHQLIDHADTPLDNSVSAHDYDQRRAVLTPLAHSARTALTVACGAPLESHPA